MDHFQGNTGDQGMFMGFSHCFAGQGGHMNKAGMLNNRGFGEGVLYSSAIRTAAAVELNRDNSCSV
jgi:hypothetical protein